MSDERNLRLAEIGYMAGKTAYQAEEPPGSMFVPNFDNASDRVRAQWIAAARAIDAEISKEIIGI